MSESSDKLGRREELDLAKSWFELHVSYRASAQRYLLLSAGVLAVAYVNLLSQSRGGAFVLALVGTIVCLSYSAVEIITNVKIQRAKSVIRRILLRPGGGEQSFVAGELFGSSSARLDEGSHRIYMQDPFWMALAEATLISAFASAATYAVTDSHRILVGVGFISFALFAAVAVMSWYYVSANFVNAS